MGGLQVGGTERNPELLEHREQLVKRWVDPIILELDGCVEEDTGLHPKCIETPLTVFKHGIGLN